MLTSELDALREAPGLRDAPLALLVNCRGAVEADCVSPDSLIQWLRLGGRHAALGCRVLGLTINDSADTARSAAALEWTWSVLAPEQVRHGLQLPDAPRATAAQKQLRLLQVLSDQQTRGAEVKEVRAAEAAAAAAAVAEAAPAGLVDCHASAGVQDVRLGGATLRVVRGLREAQRLSSR